MIEEILLGGALFQSLIGIIDNWNEINIDKYLETVGFNPS